jgi:hypothetical protein
MTVAAIHQRRRGAGNGLVSDVCVDGILFPLVSVKYSPWLRCTACCHGGVHGTMLN